MNEKMDELISLYEGYFENLSIGAREELEDKLEELLEEFKDRIEQNEILWNGLELKV